MRLADLRVDNIELLVKLSVNYYNHSPKSSLQNHSPMEFFTGISMPTNFSKLEISTIRDQQDKDLRDYMENFEIFQNELTKAKIENYFLKSNLLKIDLKENDYVLVRDPRKIVGHENPARGPYQIKETDRSLNRTI
jgi:hypothetical protein